MKHLFSISLVLGCLTAICLAEESVSIEILKISRLAVPFDADDKPSCVSATKDGRLLAFQMDRPGGYGGLDIWLSRFEGGRWSAPFNVGPGINTSAHEADAKLSPDGSEMVFVRSADFRKSSQIYISRWDGYSWAAAQPIGQPVSLPDTVQFGALLSKDGRRLYFASNRQGGYGDFDLYYSERTNGGWGEPVNLGPGLNTEEREVDLALGPQEKTIILPLPNNGNMDLYISRKREDGWSSPESLGPRVNTPGTEACPFLSYDGRILYLNSDFDGLLYGNKGSNSLWMIEYSSGFEE